MYTLQVQEKLTRVEYKEFLDFLKALKSKAMNKEDVLLSITRLFSPPDRISLLHGYCFNYVSQHNHFLRFL